MKKSPALAACLTALIAGCGASSPLAVESSRIDSAPTTPVAPAAAGTLAKIPDSAEGRTRVGYVNVDELSRLGGPLSADEITRLVLGNAGATRASSASGLRTAVQVGETTVLEGESRTMVGGTPAFRRALAQEPFDTSVITEESPSTVQSCLGNAAAQVIVGSDVVGPVAAIGAGVIDTADQPAGPKLLVCAAPHYRRQVHQLEHELTELFPAQGPPAGRAVTAEVEIGEREMVGSAVLLAQVDRALLRDLLSGGPALVSLMRK